MPRAKQTKPPKKGEPIRFVRGTYKGETGWMDRANKKSRRSKKNTKIWVIVDEINDDETEGIHTQVEQTSVRNAHTQATTWAEAAVQQHPDLESKIIEMTRHFAACDIEGHQDGVLALVGRELEDANQEMRASKKAKWFRVDWAVSNKRSKADQFV